MRSAGRGIAVGTTVVLMVSGCGVKSSGDTVTSPAAVTVTSDAPLTDASDLESGTPASPPAGSVFPFVGTWTAVGSDGVAMIDRFPVRIEVSGDHIAATAGCRLMTTTFTSVQTSSPDGHLRSDMKAGPGVTTERRNNCSPELNALDDWLAALLSGPMSWTQLPAGSSAGAAVTVVAGDEPAGRVDLQQGLVASAADPTVYDDPGLVGSYALSEWTPYDTPAASDPAAPTNTPNYPEKPQLLLTFGATSVSVQNICGTSTGTYRLAPGALEVADLTTVPDPNPACDPASQAFDDQVMGLLTGPAILLRQGNVLALDARSARGFGVKLNRVAVPADPLLEGAWTLHQYQRAGTDAVAPDVTATLELTGGRLSLFAGCNSMGGMAYVADGVITVDSFRSTAVSCGPARDALESALMSPFGAEPPPTYAVDEATLTITSPDITLTFAR